MSFITNNNYDSILRSIEKLMNIKPEVEKDSDTGILLSLLVDLVQEYEKEEYRELINNVCDCNNCKCKD